MRTQGLQFRCLRHMVKAITDARESDEVEGSISSFQAFAIGVASRVGTDNIVGVAIANTIEGSFEVEPWVTGLVLVGLSAPIVFRGIKQVATITEWIAPFMAGMYAAARNGIKRGMFSNEAGQGSVPNAATAHSVNQGFIQSLGVFVDTIIVCTATALIILLAGVYDPAATAALGDWSKYLMTFMIFVHLPAGQLHLR